MLIALALMAGFCLGWALRWYLIDKRLLADCEREMEYLTSCIVRMSDVQ